MTPPHETVVLRTGALGDIVLAASVTAVLAPVVFVTHARWRDLAAHLPGVVRVVGWPEDPLPVRPRRVVDLQADLRARLLTASMRPEFVQRVARHDLQRRARVWWGGPPAPAVIDRYAAAARVDTRPPPWWAPSHPLDHLVLVPGARWKTKVWPAERWVALGRRFGGPVSVLGGPGDRALVSAIARDISPSASFLAEHGFAQTIDVLKTARAAVAADTGLLHLAGALGVPVVGLFGPTTQHDGFWCHRGEALSVPLPCRPCSRHGSASCPRGHHLCMAELSVDRVWSAVERVVRS
jgi:heptosyltransferase-2